MFDKVGKRPEEPPRDAEGWTDGTSRDRHDDLEAVLDAPLSDKSFEGVTIDHSRVSLAGAWPSWKDPRVDKIESLAPWPIKQYAIAFFDPYLKGVTSPDPLAELVNSHHSTAVTRLEYAEK